MPEDTSTTQGTSPADSGAATSPTETAQQGLQDALGGNSGQENKGEGSQPPADDKSDKGDAGQNTTKGSDEQSSDTKEEGKDNSGQKNKGEQKDPADQPIKDWSKVKIDLPKDVPIDQTTLSDFGKEAVKLGLTPKQAQALVSFQVDAIAKQREAFLDAGVKELNKDWGSKAEENRQSVLTLIANIDREMGGENEFSKALNACGATCYPGVCKGLLKIARAISEDSFGRGGAAGDTSQQETAYEALKAEWDKAQHRR